MSKTTYKSNHVRTTVAVGVFCALAYVCCILFHFNAAFLTFDLKDAVMTVGAMIFGPLYGLAMAIIVAGIEALTVSSTGWYGFIMNVISSGTFVFVGSLIYTRMRTLKGAVISEIIAAVSMVAMMMGANILITPFYMGATAKDVIALIPTLLLPFNTVKAVFNASIVFIIYSPISMALKNAGFTSVTSSNGSDGPVSVISSAKKNKTTAAIVMICAAVVAVCSLIFFFVKLQGSFSFLK